MSEYHRTILQRHAEELAKGKWTDVSPVQGHELSQAIQAVLAATEPQEGVVSS